MSHEDRLSVTIDDGTMPMFAEQVDRWISTDEFCAGACHSMAAYIASEEAHVVSVHRAAPSGLRAGCAASTRKRAKRV